MKSNKPDDRYPSIGDYALISNCQCAALVSRSGSIDWCCMPRADSDSCFGRLLDWGRGGDFSISPTAKNFTVSRRYIPETMILETRFHCESGDVKLFDFFAMDADAHEQAPNE